MRHLPLSEWGVRAESRSQHSPMGRGGTHLPRRQTGVLGSCVGVAHFAVKAILLARMAPVPCLAGSRHPARCWCVMEPAGGGACQPRAILAVGPGSFAGVKERGGRRMRYPGGCGTDACQPALLQPSAAFGVRREGPRGWSRPGLIRQVLPAQPGVRAPPGPCEGAGFSPAPWAAGRLAGPSGLLPARFHPLQSKRGEKSRL